ncbi:unnamed protein product [Notodromas monacha]|uniref:FCP1 homology domain-containing protein n=1 Tax=Notodromas monacha TaxID=399045 RepID=A0A7R9G9I9_9CRUS|nr:unnamed protein product [Notodromas monacha]CAG0912667.1 unnamed protein product [Notodromas monacha]
MTFEKILAELTIDGQNWRFFDLPALNDERYEKLPFSIRVLLESAIRNLDGFQVKEKDVQNILDWEKLHTDPDGVEIPFRPARVILQDLTGVPAVVDFAAMRDAVAGLGGDPAKINPCCPVDLVIDHSIQVDFARACVAPPDALSKNEEIEYRRNKERFTFLKWGAKALKNLTIVPPGSGIVHQVNLEFLARVVFDNEEDRLLYCDSLVGTDSHTTMINGLGVLGWGVGGIEAEAVMLGQAISMVLPPVVGYRILGELSPLATSTDVVLYITKASYLNASSLDMFKKATISNMCPEYGATTAFFPVDQTTIDYLIQTNRDSVKISVMKKYLELVKMFRNFADSTQDPVFSTVVELDLSSVVPSVSGPKRPHDRVPVAEMRKDFQSCLVNPVGFKGYAVSPEKLDTTVSFQFEGHEYSIGHGSVVIAAITSCTNTSNPSVMLGAGLLAKNARAAGLSVPPYIKTSLSPGSGVVTRYLDASGVSADLDALGFQTVGYGCMTCIGNSGPLDEAVGAAIEKGELICCGVLSGNRNFEGRIHPLTRANYLASPLLVIAYALAGTVDIDFETQPIGKGEKGEVYLRDIWPTRQEIQRVERECVLPSMFKEVYGKISEGNKQWNMLQSSEGMLYQWDSSSTYIKNPPFFTTMKLELQPVGSVQNARVLLNLGDSVTTDHISPAGSIARNSPAARYLASKGLVPRDFNSYGSRRGNDAIMARGTFANIRLVNKFMAKPGPQTIHLPTQQEMDIFDAAEAYKSTGTPLIVLAGKDYGSGSSRDWAAKGPFLLGIRAVIAESYERIHRSNLVGMGIIPLQYLEGQTAESLGLTGREILSIDVPEKLRPRQKLTVNVDDGKSFNVIARFDTDVELEYFRNGGPGMSPSLFFLGCRGVCGDFGLMRIIYSLRVFEAPLPPFPLDWNRSECGRLDRYPSSCEVTMDPSNPITQVYPDDSEGRTHNLGLPENGTGDKDQAKHVKKKRRRKPCCGFQWKSLLCCFRSKCGDSKACCRSPDGVIPKAGDDSEQYSPNVQDSTTSRYLLPPLKSNDGDRKCLIIDLDETLVHSSFKPISNADFVVPVEIDGVVHQVYVLKRPHVDDFLQSVGKSYECVLFTASLAKYADPVADLLDKWGVFRARLFREACVFHRGNYVKDLSRLGRELERVVIIDNSPASYIFHPDNAVPVASWFDDMSDTELLDLIPYMDALSTTKDIYSYLRSNPHPLSCKRTDRETAGGPEASSLPATSSGAIIASVEKPLNRRDGDGDAGGGMQQLTNAVGRLTVYEGASPPYGNKADCSGCLVSSPSATVSPVGSEYSFMVSNGNGGGATGPSGDGVYGQSGCSTKTP